MEGCREDFVCDPQHPEGRCHYEIERDDRKGDGGSKQRVSRGLHL